VANTSCAPPPSADDSLGVAEYALNVGFALFLLTISGLFSGLNLGLMSFTEDDLGVVISGSENPKEIYYAEKIRPLRKHGNLLLCTLLLGCTLVNAIIAVLLADLTGGVSGTIATTAAIVVFGEIVPQSVCSRHALAVGYYSLPIVYIFLLVFFPIAWPISLLLDYILGREISGVLTRKGLLALIKLNLESEAHRKETGLSAADGRVLTGALTFKDRTVGDVMTPLEHCYCLPHSTLLDQKTLLSILSGGHTRIPIYETGHPTQVSALLFCKDLIGIGFERSLPLSQVLNAFHGEQRVHRVSRTMKLNEALEICQSQHVHMLIVTEEPPAADGSSPTPAAIGIATMEDFIEEILQEEIVDETDVYVDNTQLATAANLGLTSGDGDLPPPPLKKSSQSMLTTTTTRRRPFPRVNSKKYDTTTLLKSLGARASSVWA